MADAADAAPACATGSTFNGSLGLRIGAIFILGASSLCTTLFPILAKRTKAFHVPAAVFDFAKYFGSGVIVATAFIHLLAPAFEALDNECLGGIWAEYPWPAGISLMSVFFIFIVEFYAFKLGTNYLKRRGLVADHQPSDGEGNHISHEHPIATTSETQQQAEEEPPKEKSLLSDEESFVSESGASLGAVAQILGVAILEFGIIFHSVTIGLTLAVTDDFIVLFIVIIFHQMFEGLGLGSRLAFLPLPRSYNWVPIIGAILYAFVTPLGLAIGLGVRTTYSPDSRNALIVSGVLDSLSSGILLYTGLVELLAHEWLFHSKMRDAPVGYATLCLSFVLLGAGLMALLGKWA